MDQRKTVESYACTNKFLWKQFSFCPHGNRRFARQNGAGSDARGGDAAQALAGSQFMVGLVGEKVQAAANSIAACPATKYFGVSGADFAASRYATDAAAAEAICRAAQATVVVAAATRAGRACCPAWPNASAAAPTPTSPRVAAADGKISLHRWYYRQRMEGTLTRTQRPWFIGIDPGSQPACDCGAGTATVEPVAWP